MAEQLYKCDDLLGTWEKGNEALMKSWDKLRETNAKATCWEAVEAMGKLTYIGSYVVPGIQLISVGLAITRLGKNLFLGEGERVLSEQERNIQEMRAFIEELGKHLDERLDNLEDKIESNQTDILDSFSYVRTELGQLTNEVIYEIEHSRRIIQDDLRNSDYNNRIVENTNKDNDIAKLKTLMQDKLQDPDKDPIRVLKKYFRALHGSLEHDTTLDVNTGISNGRGPAGHGTATTPLVDLGLVAKNPDIYTGLLANKIDFSEPVPNLILFNRVAQGYLEGLRRYASVGSRDAELDRLVKECTDLLLTQGDLLDRLAHQLPSVARKVRLRQDELMQGLREHRENTQLTKEHLRRKTVKVAMQKNDNFEGLTRKGILVAHHKFHYAQEICHTKLCHTYTPISRVNPVTLLGTSIGGGSWGLLGVVGGLTKLKEQLEENHKLLWAYCCFISNIDNISLEDQFSHHLEVVNPKQFHRLLDQLSADFNSTEIYEERLQHVDKLLAEVPSPPIATLTSVMDEIRDLDRKRQEDAMRLCTLL